MKLLAQRRSGSWGPRTEEPGAASVEVTFHEWEPEWAEAAEAEELEAGRRVPALAPAAVVSAAAPTILWWTPGFSTADTTAAVLASVAAALIAISIVPLTNRLATPQAGSGAGDALLFTAALASAGAAAIHFLVIGMHFDEYALYGAFFVISAIAQLVWAIWLLMRPWPGSSSALSATLRSSHCGSGTASERFLSDRMRRRRPPSAWATASLRVSRSCWSSAASSPSRA